MKSALFYIFIISVLFTSCLKDDFTTSPTYNITFSKDTVCFDTVFSGAASPIRKVMIYNNNDKSLSLNSVTLKSNGESGFYINLDGEKGTSFSNIDVLRKDSVHLFIGVNFEETKHTEPRFFNDEIVFSYNGNTQKLILEAYSWNAIRWKGGKIINNDTTITNIQPIIIYDSLVIDNNASLNIMEGTRLFLHDKTNIIVNGKLSINGNRENPVIISGDRTDNLFEDLPYAETSAQWGDIIFRPGSYDNVFRHSIIKGMTNGIVLDSCDISKKKLTIDNCNIRNSKNALINSTSSWIEAYNSIFANSGAPLIGLTGGKARFTHCTIANFYKLGTVYSPAVAISNYSLDSLMNKVEQPLIMADFLNTIIWGSRSTEISFSEINNNTDFNAENYNFKFDHCVIKARGSDDNEFINTVWNEDPKFLQTGDKYKYDFHIDSLSSARNGGEPVYAIEFPTDYDGNIRPAGNADIGALQFKPQQ